jgi:thiol-disulfide isomerase/thioredoxin
MRALAILGAAVLAAAAPARAADWSAWERTLAGWSFETQDGARATLADLRGRVVVVNFWASWCKPCKKELKHLDEWNALLDRDDVQLVAISVDRDARRMARFLESEGITLPVVHDGPEGLAKTLGIPSLPCTVVLDREGRVVRVADQAIDSPDAARELVDGLAGPAVAEGAG